MLQKSTLLDVCVVKKKKKKKGETMMMCLIWPHLSRLDDMQLELTCQCDESVLDGLKICSQCCR